MGAVHGFIKPGSLVRWSTAQIKNMKGYPLALISAVGLHVDGNGRVSFLSFVRPKQGTRVPWPLAWESSSLSYSAPFATRFLPTWSMRWKESNLLTYHDGNDQGKAGDLRAARAAFNGGGDGVQWRTSSKNYSGSSGVGGGSSSKWQIGAGDPDKGDQQRWMATRRWLNIGSNLHRVGLCL
jgi:hypothetical protein